MILIIEHENGYLPLGEVESIEEAEEVVAAYYRHAPYRDDPAPEAIAIWKRNFDGDYVREEIK